MGFQYCYFLPWYVGSFLGKHCRKRHPQIIFDCNTLFFRRYGRNWIFYSPEITAWNFHLLRSAHGYRSWNRISFTGSKTLMLWFKEQKGLATGLAVAGFGLAKVIASPLMEFLQGKVGIVNMFYVLACIYFVCMMAGHLLLKKPDGWVEEPHAKGEGKVITVFKNKTFIGIWLMFYINITCGLALISQEKGIIKAIGLGSMVGVICSLTAIFNAGGRLGFATWGDRLKDRNTVYKVIFICCIMLTGVNILTKGITNNVIITIIPLLFMVNAGYGGGFSNVPTLLSDHFGMKTISQVHGLVLSAWAFAGLTGNQLATFIVKRTGQEMLDSHGVSINPTGYQNVLYVTIVLYCIALAISFILIRPSKDKEVA